MAKLQLMTLVAMSQVKFGDPNFINPSVLAAEALDQLDYELVAGNLMYRDRTNDFANVRGMKVGEFISVRTVSDFVTNEFVQGTDVTTTAQEITQSSTQLLIEKHFDISIEVTSKERALNLDGIRQEIINPAMTSMAQKIDTFLFSKVNPGARGVYTSSALMETASDIAAARAQANVQQISKSNRIGVVSNDLEAVMLGEAVFSQFDTRGTPAIPALAEANLGRLMGIDWFSSVNFEVEVSAASPGFATTLDNTVVTDNTQGSSTLVVDATAAALHDGAPIEIAGAKRAYHVDGIVAMGATSIPLIEQIDENLSTLDGAAITSPEDVAITYEGVILNPGAFSFAAPPLDAAAGDISGVASAAGMSIRMTEAYDIGTKKTFWSFDMIIGAAAIDGRMAMSLAST